MNTGDVGSNGTLQLAASVADPAAQADSISSALLTQSYVEPSEDPFNTPSSGSLYYDGVYTTTGGVVYDAYDGLYNNSVGQSSVASASGNDAYVYVVGEPNSAINAGSGSDTIYAEFGYNVTDGGVDVINGNDGEDDILASYNPTNDGPTTVNVYGNSETDLATAVADANSGTPTGQRGDLIVNCATGPWSGATEMI